MRQRRDRLRRRTRNALVRTWLVVVGAVLICEAVALTRALGYTGSSYVAFLGIVYVGAGLFPRVVRFQGKR